MQISDNLLNLTMDLFVAPADEDYMCARWAFQNSAFSSFSWLAAQSIEKYEKAILLISGISVRSLGHDLMYLIDEITKTGKIDFNAPMPAIPVGLYPHEIDQSSSITFAQTIQKINFLGNTENRYGIIGHSYRHDFLHRFDDVCFMLRNEVIGCDESKGKITKYILKTTIDGTYNHEDALEFCQYIFNDLPVDLSIKSCIENNANNSTMNMNLCYSVPGMRHQFNGTVMSFKASPLYQLINSIKSDNDKESIRSSISGIQWLLSNTRWQKETLNELKLAIKKGEERIAEIEASKQELL